MKIISDFDGVLTAQQGEADAVGARQVEVLAEAIGDQERAETLIGECRQVVEREPDQRGWVVDGRLTCYADEDPYVFHNAVGSVLFERAPEAVIEALREAGFPDNSVFSSRCFVEGTEQWRGENDSHLDSEAVKILGQVSEAGIEVVVVSNSSTGRIESILEDYGPERLAPFSPRVRGGAQKFVVTPDISVPVGRSMELGGREILLERGHYFRILEAEAPRLVIGDVLSLDLALPLALKESVPGFERMEICFRRAAHTPSWAVDAARERGIHILDELSPVIEILEL